MLHRKSRSIKQIIAPVSKRASTLISQSNILICIEGIKEGVGFDGRKRPFIGVLDLDVFSYIVPTMIGHFCFLTSHNLYNTQ